MDKEDIIRMAREAGCTPFRSPEYWDDVQVFATPDVLERFANLVAAAERNRTWTQDHWTEYERSIAAAEREACAKVCESLNEDFDHLYVSACADVIRARGQE